MALANSSLAIAADALSDVLQINIDDVSVLVDTPAGAQKTADLTPGTHFLNLFFYRIAPSPVHAAQLPYEPLFLRLFALLTPIPKKANQNGEEYPALRILGEVVRYFHENPISGVLHAKAGNIGTAYRIQAVLQAPNMEELNHIWTTQGGDLSYQVSAAYEFLLVPVDPNAPPPTTGDVITGIYEVRTGSDALLGPSDYAIEFTSPAPAEQPGPPYLPQILVQTAAGPTATADLGSGDGKVDLVLAGAPAGKAEILLSIRDGAGTDLRKVKSVQDIKTPRLDADDAKISINANLAGAKQVIAEVRAADAGGMPLQPDAVGNTLTLTVDGG